MNSRRFMAQTIAVVVSFATPRARTAARRGIAFHRATRRLRALEHESHAAPTCKNCGTPLPGEYCPKCGQRDFDFDRSFREIVDQVAESFWSWDSKLFRGVVGLLFRPGFLTSEYLAGRRASQVPPLRFYLFVSILFFLTSSFDPSGDMFNFDEPSQEGQTISFGINPEATERIKAIASRIRPRRNFQTSFASATKGATRPRAWSASTSQNSSLRACRSSR
jgi:hypothetical protein